MQPCFVPRSTALPVWASPHGEPERDFGCDQALACCGSTFHRLFWPALERRAPLSQGPNACVEHVTSPSSKQHHT